MKDLNWFKNYSSGAWRAIFLARGSTRSRAILSASSESSSHQPLRGWRTTRGKRSSGTGYYKTIDWSDLWRIEFLFTNAPSEMEAEAEAIEQTTEKAGNPS